MYASVSSLFTSFNSSIVGVLITILTAVLAVLGGLLALGFGIRHVRKWITGKKA